VTINYYVVTLLQHFNNGIGSYMTGQILSPVKRARS